ncbi:MAG: M56 family metallopeptidase [Phycisphaerae bacterium]|jgi:beta-lactamase regulating signal transducer with metallopeptidase domain
MEILESILSQQIVEKLGWVLIHFVWQGIAVAILAAAVLRLLKKASSNIRYLVACIALAVVVLLPAATFKVIGNKENVSKDFSTPATMSPPLEMTKTVNVQLPAVENNPQQVIALPEVPLRERFVRAVEPMLPYAVLGWLVGVAGLSLWYLGGWTQLQRLRRRMVKPVCGDIKIKLTQLSQKLGISVAVDIVESAIVNVPTVIGYFKPIILLPATALTGLSGEQIAAILAHELAHIKRCDYLVNILQTVVEILGFYHPAVWWISNKIRYERENCCDDIAVKVTGDNVNYASALATMEEIRFGQSQLAVAASGGNLFNRICRLLGKDSANESKASLSTRLKTSWVPSVIAVILIGALAVTAVMAVSKAEEPQRHKGTKNIATEDTPSAGFDKLTTGSSGQATSTGSGQAEDTENKKAVVSAFNEYITAVRGNDTEKLREIANRQADFYKFNDAEKRYAVMTVALDANALRAYKGIENLTAASVEDDNQTKLTNVITSQITDTRGVSGRLVFGFVGRDKPILETIYFVNDGGKKLRLRPQVLTTARILSVPQGWPGIKEFPTGCKFFTPEELEKFLKVVKADVSVKMLSAPMVLANDGEDASIRTGGIEFRIKNNVQPGRKSINAVFELKYDCGDLEKTSNEISGFLPSNSAIVVRGEPCDGNEIILIVQPKIMEESFLKTGIAEDNIDETKSLDPNTKKLGETVAKKITTYSDEEIFTLQDGETAKMKVKENIAGVTEVLITPHIAANGTRFDIKALDDKGNQAAECPTTRAIHDGATERTGTNIQKDGRQIFFKIQLSPTRQGTDSVAVAVKMLFTESPTWEELQAMLLTRGKEGRIQLDFADISMRIMNYKSQHGSYPKSLEDINQPLPKDVYSQSGQEYHYESNQKRFILSSCGEDKVYGNNDDNVSIYSSHGTLTGQRNELYPLEEDGETKAQQQSGIADTPAIIASNENFNVLDVNFEPIRQGKNILWLTMQNKSDKERFISVNVYSRSVDYGKDGVGWGTNFYDRFDAGQIKRIRYVYKIQGPITDNTYTRLYFYNVKSLIHDENKDIKPFAKKQYFINDLKVYSADNERAVTASKEDFDAVTKVFAEIQGYISSGDYEKAWNLFSSDCQKMEYHIKGLDEFKLQMKPKHPLDSAFLWEKKDFLKLKPMSAYMDNGKVVLAAAIDNSQWKIDFVRQDGQWKVDGIIGYKPKILEM